MNATPPSLHVDVAEGSQPTSELEQLRTTVTQLTKRCAAQEKTIPVLVDAAEARQAAPSDNPFQVFQQSLALRKVVDEKTRALELTVAQLGETQALLLHAQKLEAVGQLAAGVAHEINTPMQYVGDNLRFLEKAFASFLELARRVASMQDPPESLSDLDTDLRLGFLRARVPRSITQALEGVQAVSRIVSAMKEFSHPGSDDKHLVDVNHLIETTQTVSRNEWKYCADVTLDLDPDLPKILAHGGELNQVFLNLVVNAAHAIDSVVRGTAERGVITISTRVVEGVVEVRVRDTGCGIPEAIRTRIFDPFFTTKEVGRGTGQGLAIARSIVVDKHQGTLSVDSEVGVGTTFVVKLPIGGAS